MTFFEHIDALRPHLVRGALFLFVVIIAAFFSKKLIVDYILMGPRSELFPTNRFFAWLAGFTGVDALRLNDFDLNMINTAIAGQFNLHLKISFVTAFSFSFPYIIWELWRFVKPALTTTEIRASCNFVLYVSLCFFTGLLFGYFIISPLTINFLGRYTVTEGIVNMIDISSYLSTVVNISLACAIVFQLPLLIYFLASMGIISSAFMRKYRRHAVIILAVFSAVITPPDLFSLILVAIPLYGLYEYGIRIAKNVEISKLKTDGARASNY